MPCDLCARGIPHHTNSRTSIGGPDRFTVWDLHAVEDTGGVGLAECTDPVAAMLRDAYRTATAGTAR